MMETIKASNICCLDAPFAFSGEKRNINKYFSKLSSIVLLTFLSVSLFGQYSETFSIANKGILIGPCTTNDPTTCASFDFTGVNWTIEGNLSGLVSGAGGTTDDFQTLGGVLTSSGDIDEEICWVSPMLTISGTSASFSCDISWIGGYNDGDYLDVEYNVNGGGWTTVTSLPQSGGGHTINGFSTPTPELPDGSSTVAVNSLGASGQSIQIRMCVDFNSFTESFTL
ncbi:MAG: hypothetical protein R2788_19620, partial [Saprospiraceae bacterium]